MKRTILFSAAAALFANAVTAQGHAREGQQVIADRDAMQDSELWLYNDVDAGLLRARESGKPLLVVFR
jgi:hypothetical protein